MDRPFSIEEQDPGADPASQLAEKHKKDQV